MLSLARRVRSVVEVCATQGADEVEPQGGTDGDR
jgi:hypothetical protein